MMRCIVCLLLLIGFLGCNDGKEERAKELESLVDQYRKEGNYDQAIKILQLIATDFANTERAAKAEEEIEEYGKLKVLLVQNKHKELETEFQSIGRALENFRTRYQAYPLTIQGLEKLSATMLTFKGADPWGREFHYRPMYSDDSVPKHLPDRFVLASFGQDGLPGGEGLDKDYFYQDDRVVERIITE